MYVCIEDRVSYVFIYRQEFAKKPRGIFTSENEIEKVTKKTSTHIYVCTYFRKRACKVMDDLLTHNSTNVLTFAPMYLHCVPIACMQRDDGMSTLIL